MSRSFWRDRGPAAEAPGLRRCWAPRSAISDRVGWAGVRSGRRPIEGGRSTVSPDLTLSPTAVSWLLCRRSGSIQPFLCPFGEAAHPHACSLTPHLHYEPCLRREISVRLTPCLSQAGIVHSNPAPRYLLVAHHLRRCRAPLEAVIWQGSKQS